MKKLKSLPLDDSWEEKCNHQPSSNSSNLNRGSVCNYRRISHSQVRGAGHNDGSPHQIGMSVTPRPPLHKMSPVASNPNERRVLCKRCGTLSANISTNCCLGGKESKFPLSSSISISPANKSRASKDTHERKELPEHEESISNDSNNSKIIQNISKKHEVKKDPVVLLLSSDDEYPEISVAPRLKKAAKKELAMSTLQLRQEEINWSPAKDELKNDLLQIIEADISSIYEPFMCVKCEKVNIGSYKTSPTDRILFMRSGVRFSVYIPNSSQESVTIALPTKHLLKIFWYSAAKISFLVFCVKEKLAQHIRNLLGMHAESELYFDPCSEEDSEKQLIIFPGQLIDDILNQLNLFYNGSSDPKFFQQIKQDVTNKSFLSSITNEGKSETVQTMSPTDPNIICHFTARGLKGGITLTIDDFLCLEEGEFFNDVIIDFYLRYLVFKQFKPSVASRTHVFSTFFYKRLTSRVGSNTSEDAGERRHNRVQNWTKGVDIFDKDFIIIPINKKFHWFLAIICFPNMDSPVRIRDGAKIPYTELMKTGRNKQIVENGNIFKDESERDESSSDSSHASFGKDEYRQDEPVKQPCIIIFDSLQGANQTSAKRKVAATLRSYLRVEHLRRKQLEKHFTKLTMRCIFPAVPQQPNFYDCGVYILQYAESFFTHPLKDYSESISLEDWFSSDDVKPKREKITQLIKALRKEQFPNTSFEFPMLTTRSELESCGMMSEFDSRYKTQPQGAEPTDQSEDEEVNNFSWTDTLKNSFSKIKRHFSTEETPFKKKCRIDSKHSSDS